MKLDAEMRRAVLAHPAGWIASGFGGWLDTEPYQAGHYAVMQSFLDIVYRAAQRACGLRVSVTGPSGMSSA